MAARSDVEAGRAFTTLYVRDELYRRQLAEDRELFLGLFDFGGSGPQQLSIDASGYEDMASLADAALELVYDDTILLTDATYELADAIREVYDAYDEIAALQGEGLTLNMGMGGGGVDMAQLSGTRALADEYGFQWENVGKEFGEGLEDIPKSTLNAIGGNIGYAIFHSDAFQNAVKRLPFAGEVQQTVGFQPRRAAASGIPNMPTGAAVEAPVMAELAGAAAPAATSMASLATGASSVTAALGPLAIAAALAVPVLAALDDATEGSLSKSGMYPAWLKKIGDSLNSITIIGPAVKLLVESLKTLWNVISLGYRVVSPFVRVALIPLRLAVQAATVPIRAMTLAMQAAQLPFTVTRKAIEVTREAIASIPAVATAAGRAVVRLAEAGTEGLKRMGAAALAAARGLASAAWTGAVGTLSLVKGTIDGIGSSMQSIGKRAAILGGGLTAIAAAVVGPLTKAAQLYSDQASKIRNLTEAYRNYGLAAEEASVYAYIASQAGGLLGEMGEAERINNIMRTVKAGTPEFEEWRKQAEASGAVMSGPMADAASALSDAYKRLRESLKGLWQQLGRAVAPIIAESTEVMVGAVRGVTKWVKENQQLIATAFKVASVVASVGTAMAALGGTLVAVGSAVSPLTVLLAGVAGAMAVVEYRTQAGATLWGSYKDSVVALYGTVMKNLQPILDEAKRVFGGVTDAIKGGDLELAARIAWNGFKTAWIEGLLWLSDRTSGTLQGILLNLSGGNWKAAADGAMGMIESAVIRLKGTIDSVWQDVLTMTDRLWSGIQTGFDVAIGAVETSWYAALENMKVWGAQLLEWMQKNVFEALATAVRDKGPIGELIAGKALDAARELMQLRRGLEETKKSPEQQASEAEAVDQRIAAKRESREQAMADRRESREEGLAAREAARQEQIAAAESRGMAEPAASTTTAEQELEAARAQLDADIKTAREQAEAMAQPDGPQKVGNLSGQITSSAFAFGGFGAAPPDQKQVEELRKMRDEAKQRAVEDRKEREAFREYAERIERMMANMAIFDGA